MASVKEWYQKLPPPMKILLGLVMLYLGIALMTI